MKLSKSSSPNEFILEGLTFAELVIIKKACAAYASQGSAPAGQIVQKLEDAMDNTTV